MHGLKDCILNIVPFLIYQCTVINVKLIMMSLRLLSLLMLCFEKKVVDLNLRFHINCHFIKIIQIIQRPKLVSSFNEKIHCSFSLVKINLTFRLSRNLLQSWSTFFCVILDCSPSNGSLKYTQTCQNDLLSKMTNAESVEANSHTVVT